MSDVVIAPQGVTRSLAQDATVARPIVYVIDDDEAVRRSVAMLLASFGHATQLFASAEAFLAAQATLQPGCVIADIRMPGMDGLALQQEMRRRRMTLPVVIVTGHADVSLAVQAMKAGAIDFIEKPYSEEDLMQAVAAALERMKDARAHQAAAAAATARIAALTPRERDVLRRLVDGRPNKVIAHDLGISPRTVEIHRANVMDKLGCRSVAQAVRLAMVGGIGRP
jgi:two-component system response regulator FixJ